MKICKKCGAEKPLSCYYAHPKMKDGHDSKCKDCAKKMAADVRNRDIERTREYDRERSKLPHRMKANAENTKRYREREKRRYKCNNAVNNALRDGRLQKMPCWICGSEQVEGHHPDYDSPLDVVWLCPIHHKEIHLRHSR